MLFFFTRRSADFCLAAGEEDCFFSGGWVLMGDQRSGKELDGERDLVSGD